MQRRVAVLLGALMVLGVFAFVRPAAEAHTCDPNTGECDETPVMPNWRDNYAPLFDLEDRENEEQRRDAQRWRDECDDQSQCIWADSNTSLTPDENGDIAPNEAHAGIGASHCFAFEAFHQCEDHTGSGDPDNPEEGVHDAHGGSIYVDACLAQNNDPATNQWCDDGLEDTQAGVTVMDHNPCGLVVPVASCTDEYHVVRPLDTDYTQAQVNDTAAWPERTLADPAAYICGKRNFATPCVDFVNTIWGLLPLP